MCIIGVFWKTNEKYVSSVENQIFVIWLVVMTCGTFLINTYSIIILRLNSAEHKNVLLEIYNIVENIRLN